MKSINKITYIIFVVLLSCVLFNCGETDKEEPQSLIFPELEAITSTSYNTGTDTFHYYLPPEVAYAVLGIFNSHISTNNGIVNEANLVAGSTTSLGMTRGSVTKANIYIYDPITKNFIGGVYLSGTNLYWAVWGYDKYGNLTHSSEENPLNPYP